MLTEEEFTQAVKMNMDTVYRVAAAGCAALPKLADPCLSQRVQAGSGFSAFRRAVSG